MMTQKYCLSALLLVFVVGLYASQPAPTNISSMRNPISISGQPTRLPAQLQCDQSKLKNHALGKLATIPVQNSTSKKVSAMWGFEHQEGLRWARYFGTSMQSGPTICLGELKKDNYSELNGRPYIFVDYRERIIPEGVQKIHIRPATAFYKTGDKEEFETITYPFFDNEKPDDFIYNGNTKQLVKKTEFEEQQKREKQLGASSSCKN